LINILVGVWASKRVHTSGDFMLAGRSLPMALSTAALFATWFGSETVFGASSRFLEGGLYSVIEDPFGAALCLLLFGLFFARKLYGMNLLTLADFFRVRYGKRTELVASILLIPSYFGYTAAQLVALGLVLNVVAGIEVWQGVILSAGIVTVYTFVGGMWAISITDFFQSIIIVAGLLVLAVVLVSQAGGIGSVLESVPSENLKFFPDFTFTEVTGYLAAWSVLGLGSIPSQDVFQRVMSSGSERVAVRSCYLAAILYLTVALLPLLISLCVKHLYADQLEGDLQLVLPRMVLNHTGIGIQILFFGSLLSAIMSTTSSTILAPAAILSENIIRPLSGGRYTDSHLLRTTRISVVVFSAMATAMACMKSNIYELVGNSSILSLVSLFIPMALGLYWQKATAFGAIASMLLGLIAWLVFLYVIPISIPALVPALLVSLLTYIVGSFVRIRI
jgi:SSS family transporter